MEVSGGMMIMMFGAYCYSKLDFLRKERKHLT
jgi:xanthine/uracil permease